MDDLRYQLERVFRGKPERNERDVGLHLRRNRADLFNVDLTRDHLVAEPSHNLSERLKPIASLVGDKNAEVLGLFLRHFQQALSALSRAKTSSDSQQPNFTIAAGGHQQVQAFRPRLKADRGSERLGDGGFEPPTSALSERRSNRLS